MNVQLDEWSRYLLCQLAAGKTWENCKADYQGIEDAHLAVAAQEVLSVLEQAQPLMASAQRQEERERRTRELRQCSPKHGKRWSHEESESMCDMWMSGLSFDEIGNRLQRTAGSIRARLHKFGLVDEDGNPLLPRRDMDASNLQWHVDHTGQWQPVDRDSLVAP